MKEAIRQALHAIDLTYGVDTPLDWAIAQRRVMEGLHSMLLRLQSMSGEDARIYVAEVEEMQITLGYCQDQRDINESGITEGIIKIGNHFCPEGWTC